MLRWGVFVLLFWTLPFPLFGLEGLSVPTARFLQLALWLSMLVVLEGAGGMVGSMLALLWLHSLVYCLILYLGSRVAARWVAAHVSTAAGRWLLVATALALVSWGVFGEPYDSSFHHSEAHASLVELYR